MTLCRWKYHKATILVVGWAIIALWATGIASADPAGGFALQRVGENTSLMRPGIGNPDGLDPRPLWSEPASEAVARPPAERLNARVVTSLTSAAILRPMKDRKFALALTAGTSSARASIFKNNSANRLMLSPSDTIQWVVLADTFEPGETIGAGNGLWAEGTSGFDTGTWQYSVEMIFVPLAELALRAGVSLDPVEDEFQKGEFAQIFQRSRIGVSIGLDYRPKEGVVLDFDYLRVMQAGEVLQDAGNIAASPVDKDGGGVEDVVQISLSIQF